MKNALIACGTLVALALAGSPAYSQCPPVHFQLYDGTSFAGSEEPCFNANEAFGIVVDGLPAEHFPLEVLKIGFGTPDGAASADLEVYDTYPPPDFFPTPTYRHPGVSAAIGLNEYDVTPSGPMILTTQPFTVAARGRSESMYPLHDGNGCARGADTSIYHYTFVPNGWHDNCPHGLGDWVFWIEYQPLAASPCPAPSFCDASDGSLAACPCGNAGTPDSGCDIAQATGGIDLQLLAQATSPTNRATLSSSGYPGTGHPATVVIRASALDPSSPVVFGDGLRCVGVPLVRVGGSFAFNGTATHVVDHGAGPAGTHYYQVWLRNNPAMYCTPDAFNLSQGRVLGW